MSAGAILYAYFGWPVGAVYSNLIASAICAAFVYLRLRAQQQRHHLAEIAHQKKLHEEMKAHIAAQPHAVLNASDPGLLDRELRAALRRIGVRYPGGGA